MCFPGIEPAWHISQSFLMQCFSPIFSILLPPLFLSRKLLYLCLRLVLCLCVWDGESLAKPKGLKSCQKCKKSEGIGPFSEWESKMGCARARHLPWWIYLGEIQAHLEGCQVPVEVLLGDKHCVGCLLTALDADQNCCSTQKKKKFAPYSCEICWTLALSLWNAHFM